MPKAKALQTDDSEHFERDNESQFVSQDGDEDILWEVVEITDEKSSYYKVRWAGIDPQTKKPWAQSWVKKSDCTDDLVLSWKRKKAQKKKKASAGRASRQSNASRMSVISRDSIKSESTATKWDIGNASATTTSSKRANENGKRTRSSMNEQETAVSVRPKKRRKMGSNQTNRRSTIKSREYVPSGSDDDLVDEAKSTGRISAGKVIRNVESLKEEEEETSSEDAETERKGISPARSLSTARNGKVGPTRSPSPAETPESRTAYVKFKSGKISTPMKKTKRQSSESVAEASSSSDEVEELVPVIQSPSPPPRESMDSLPTINSEALVQVQGLPHASRQLVPPIEAGDDEDEDEEEETIQEMYEEFVDFDAVPVQAAPRRGTTNGVNDDSYRKGVVPETETESPSQSQSQSQPSAQRPTVPREPTLILEPPSPSRQSGQHKPTSFPSTPSPERHLAAPAATTQGSRTRSPLISRMRPRTPGSSSRISLFDSGDALLHQPELAVHKEIDEEQHEDETDQDEDAEYETDPDVDEEPHQPPQKQPSVSGSKIPTTAASAQLRPIPRLSPSAFKPHLETAASSSSRRSRAESEAEVTELVSSIEQFSSPVKGRRKDQTPHVEVDWKGKGKEKEPAPVAGSSNQNGHVSAAEDSFDDIYASGEEGDLETVVRERGEQLAARARAEQVRLQRRFAGEGKRKTLDELLTQSAKRRGKQKRQLEQDNSEREVEKMRRLSKRQVSGPWWEQREKGRKKKKQKVDESDTEQDQDYSVHQADPQNALEVVEALRQEEEESTQEELLSHIPEPIDDVDMEQGWSVEPAAQADEEEVEQLEPPLAIEVQHPVVVADRRSKSKSSAHSSHTGNNKPSQDDLVLPPTAPLPLSSQVESQESDTRPDFVATLALLNEKSLENAQLAQDIQALREALALVGAPQVRELELERELEAARINLRVSQASLAESEKRVAELTRGKESAEKDREFFREHYAQASGFVTSVREENVVLQQEAQISKEQASSGVEVVKATYAARVKALEDDVKTYKRLAMFIMEKDIRTNDDIRRRAAEEPELRARCEELAEDNRALKNRLSGLTDDLEDKETEVKDLRLRLHSWKKQVTLLNADLNKVKSLQEGEDRVYQCGWRVGDDANVPCGQLFASYEEFERHMFTGRHLDATRTLRG